MTKRHLAVGEMGEELAAAYLRERGLAIVERRVRFPRGELDIVARDGREWVFVEVKTRTTPLLGSAAEALTSRKAARTVRAAKAYALSRNLGDVDMRCDLVAVDIGPNGEADIKHFPAAFPME